MKNDSKLDIQLAMKDEAELTQDQIDDQNLATALRYIEIAKYMNKYQDQDTYYHRALKYVKLVAANKKEYKSLVEELRHAKCQVRAEGKLASYKEACEIRDRAKTPEDYESAARIFEEIHKYEEKHPLYEKYTTPEVYKEAVLCNDSAEQIKKCRELGEQKQAELKKKALIGNVLLTVALVAALFFTRTLAFRHCLASAYSIIHNNEGAWKAYKNIYDHNGDQTAYEKYCEHCYAAAEDALKAGDFETARKDFKTIAVDNYKDSRAQLALREKYNVANTEIGEIVNFADMNWVVLDRDGDNVFLIKDKAIAGVPMKLTSGDVTWATSDLRAYLNKEFIEENIYEEELATMVQMHLVGEDNPVYGTDGGEDTDDYVAVLSASEIEKYQEQLRVTENCWWTRTPGSTSASMAYAYLDKSVVYSGTDGSVEQNKVKPVIMVNTAE